MPTFDQNNTFDSRNRFDSRTRGIQNFTDKPFESGYTPPNSRRIGSTIRDTLTPGPQNATLGPQNAQNNPYRSEIDSLKKLNQALRRQIQAMQIQLKQVVQRGRPQGRDLNASIREKQRPQVEQQIIKSGVKPNKAQMKTLQNLGVLRQAPKLSKFQRALRGDFN